MVQPLEVGSTRYVTHVVSFTKLPYFSRATLKSWEEPGYEAIARLIASGLRPTKSHALGV